MDISKPIVEIQGLTKIYNGSSTQFNTAPITILYIESAGLPSVLAILESEIPSTLNGNPINIIAAYCIEYSILASVAPNNVRIGLKKTKPITAKIIPLNTDKTSTFPNVCCASSSLFSPFSIFFAKQSFHLHTK